jgi:hypothetical protein
MRFRRGEIRNRRIAAAKEENTNTAALPRLKSGR